MTQSEEQGAGVLDHKWLDQLCIGNGCQSLFLDQLLSASKAVVQLIEGFPGYGTCTNADGRLKDQDEWVSFYVLVADLAKSHPPQTQSERSGHE